LKITHEEVQLRMRQIYAAIEYVAKNEMKRNVPRMLIISIVLLMGVLLCISLIYA